MELVVRGLAAIRWLLMLAGLLAIALPAMAAERRVALVIGVAAYRAVPPLKNTRTDARKIASSLQRLGFQVDMQIDPDRAGLEAAVRRIGSQAKGADAAFIYYAGHALELDGRNWLLPTNANPSSIRDLRFEGFDLDSLMEQLDGMARITIVMLDSCRDNPFRMRLTAPSRGLPQTAGLAPPHAPVGTLIAFATAPGMVAQDGNGEDSPFTTSLLAHMEAPGLEIRGLLNLVRRDVRLATGGQQVPWEHSALEGEFFLKPLVLPAAPPQPDPAQAGTVSKMAANGADAELLFWQGVRDTNEASDLLAYLQRFPKGVFADLARNRLAKLAPQPDPTHALLFDRLVAAMSKTGDLKQAPYQADWIRTDAHDYAMNPGLKAIAIEPDSGRSFRWWDLPTTAAAEQLALEGCQQAYGHPCVLLAVGDEIKAPDPRQALRIAMPRLAYAGPFRIDMVPLMRPNAVPEAIQSYSKQPSPKALAMRPVNAQYALGAGATAAAAQATALAGCNANTSPYPCFLYAIDDTVVLPHRWTEVTAGP